MLFKIADDHGWLLLDIPDLTSLLLWVEQHKEQVETSYGHISDATISSIRRDLLVLQDAGGHSFFGEPALDL